MRHDSSRAPAAAPVHLSEVAWRPMGSAADVLAGVSLTLNAGERLSLVGRSGCGKTTLLRLIAGLLPQSQGSIAIGMAEIDQRRAAQCALASQTDTLLPWARLDDNVGLGLRAAGASRAAARRQAAAALDRWGLGGRRSARPDELSGGMRQRAQLMRALLSERPVLLADEPFGALDAITRSAARRWMREVLDDLGTTLVLVTHDIEEALLMGDRVLVLGGAPAQIVLERDGWGRAGVDDDDLIAEPSFVRARRDLIAAIAEDSACAA
ncbi:ABC transporter ATP-binding protein [Pseudoclavibacter soli]|uniref:ABC transporter ATP-binding protein n=1 Tax=Pseudoclavibacter soli TaxID=452623 RepID=UPI000412A83D|nr:ATP-binding cassette domain-containing protein [Pseudoclavibacter soli]